MNLSQVQKLVVGGELITEARFAELQQQWLADGKLDRDGDEFVQHLCVAHELSDFQAAAVRAGIPGPYLLGPYKVMSHLATGRLGDVFQAEHVEFGQPVSLKIFPATLGQNPERMARLGREARVGLEADHRHVVKTFQIGKVGDVPFIAMEQMRGESLEHRLSRDGRLPYADACQLIGQAAEGLSYLHSIDVIHRDICPANLWITQHEIVKIMEFGAARDALAYLDSLDESGGGLTLNSSELLGTYAYMSAEQAKDASQANAASDLYSLGCTLFHSLTGQVPFPDKNPMRQMLRQATELPPKLNQFDEDIPDAVQAIVSKLLAKNSADRYELAEDVAADLAKIAPPPQEIPIDSVNAEFLQALQTGDDLTEFTEYEPEFAAFLEWVSDAKINAVLSGRPTF